ncbi:MAG: imidazolonepropionase [Nitrospinaceae bacterium]|nr:imidazolonepropionase [Nitrospinaceae bacterium]NIR57307.1 imidazolonepropionase [Nitrospinaceae bacterium]NIS87759.1 imidazolonepropionase [Nitrospinaceae bacterium]NIT84629.1 imidazolonepropionase [Nitrospinaceae bacterium]NIU46808.1 imidazolonepropionase [Nitrospinaceae bacterium]
MTGITCFRNIGQLVQADANSQPGVRLRKNCALLVKDGRILKILKESEVGPARAYAKVIDCQGRAVVPGFVDCHTHLIHAGERKDEMVDRMAGIDYMEILENGGGILSTVKATRRATEKDLYDSARKRIRRMMALGTTAFEIKSGYGLNFKSEMKMLNVGKKLRDSLKVPVTLTCLAAHAIPEGEDREAYLEDIIDNLPRFRNVADGVDIFCEHNVFTAADLRRLFLQAKLLGFDLRAHVDEFSHQGGCFDAAKLGALSCDHLEHAIPKDIQAMHAAGTTAVLMPGVTLFLGGEKHPLVHSMLDAGVTLALATDFNPGSSPTYNMQTVLYLAASMYRITPEQALAAGTYGGAKALGHEKLYGGLLIRQRADFNVLKTNDYRDMFYYFGENFVDQTYSAGRRVKGAKDPAA